MDFVAKTPIPERLREPLRAALRGQAGIWPETLREEEVAALTEHGVAPLVFAATHDPALRAEAIRAAALEPLRAADLEVVLAALASAGVHALVLKGSALAYDLYASPELRPRGDTDLLISRNDVEAARGVFAKLGLREQVTSGDEHGVKQLIFTRANGLAYDVHWSVTNLPLFEPLLRYDDVRTRALALPRLGSHAFGLSHPDALLLACIHRVAHHHDSDRLIWLADIAFLAQRMAADERATFLELARRGGVVAICKRSIELASEWFGETPLALPEVEGEASAVMLDREITHGAMLVANLRALSWRARAQRLWQLAFPPAAFMRASFGPRSRAALPWLYVYRGMRGIGRLFRRARHTL